jgi:hypothetical protein
MVEHRSAGDLQPLEQKTRVTLVEPGEKAYSPFTQSFKSAFSFSKPLLTQFLGDYNVFCPCIALGPQEKG